MNVIVHYPEKSEDRDMLLRKVAIVHADAVLRKIQRLTCSREQKLELINSLKRIGLRSDAP